MTAQAIRHEINNRLDLLAKLQKLNGLTIEVYNEIKQMNMQDEAKLRGGSRRDSRN